MGNMFYPTLKLTRVSYANLHAAVLSVLEHFFHLMAIGLSGDGIATTHLHMTFVFFFLLSLHLWLS